MLQNDISTSTVRRVHGRQPGERVRQQILAAIASLTAVRGYPPTLREIGAAIGITSTGQLSFHLDRLAHSGHVTWQPGAKRSLRLTQPTAAHACALCAALDAENARLQREIDILAARIAELSAAG